MSVIFDKLKYVQRLESGAGFARAQAEHMSDALHDALSESVATSTDIGRLEVRIDAMEGKLEGRLSTFEAKMDGKLGMMDAKIDTSASKIDASLATMKVLVAGVGIALFSALTAIRFFGH